MALRGVAGEPGTRGVGGGSGLACMPWGQSVTHSLKLCRSLRRMSPMYSQATQRRKVRDSTPNQIQSHCKGAREKVVAIHTSGSESPTAGSSRGFLPGIGLLCRQLFPYLRELCFLGRESTPPTASAHTWPLSPLPSGLCLGLPAPHPLSTLLVRILSLGNFLQWQLYRQWKQRAQAEQQRGDSAMVRAWGK